MSMTEPDKAANLHQRIMNIPVNERMTSHADPYRIGHRDARHAAAEMAQEREEELLAENARMREALEFYADKEKWDSNASGFNVFNGAGAWRTAPAALKEPA